MISQRRKLNEMKTGQIGVMLHDTRIPCRMYRMLDWPQQMGVAYFEPLDDPGAVVPALLADFWALL